MSKEKNVRHDFVLSPKDEEEIFDSLCKVSEAFDTATDAMDLRLKAVTVGCFLRCFVSSSLQTAPEGFRREGKELLEEHVAVGVAFAIRIEEEKERDDIERLVRETLAKAGEKS